VNDLDTKLGLKTPFEEYFEKSLKDPHFPTWYRVVPAKKFLEDFASDRSHMREKKNNSWIKPPPSYTPIRGGKATTQMNLMDYIDTENSALGNWYNAEQLLKFFGARST